jgi:integrase
LRVQANLSQYSPILYSHPAPIPRAIPHKLMAYLRKLKSGWRAQVEKLGVRRSMTWPTKAEAANWAAATEAEILAGKSGQYPRKTFADALLRYADEVSARKEGARWELLRIEALIRGFPALAAMQFSEVRTPHMASWRDARLAQVSPGTVQREANLFSNVFQIGRREWHWCGESPFSSLRPPGDNPPRQRVPTWREIKAICRWLGHHTQEPPQTKQAEVALAYLIGLASAMRAQEILSLGDDVVDYKHGVARVAHKMQYQTGRPREIPLPPRALRLIGRLKGRGRYFTVSESSRDALFRKATRALMIRDLTFHDGRGAALTWLARRTDVMTLSRISGIKDLNLLVRVYYRETSADVAARLARRSNRSPRE